MMTETPPMLLIKSLTPILVQIKFVTFVLAELVEKEVN